MTVRKIDAMYKYYGIGSGRCENCPHFVKKYWEKAYHKCTVYGESNAESTDWKKGYRACGLIDKSFPEGDRRIVELIMAGHMDDEPLPGQLSFAEVKDD